LERRPAPEDPLEAQRAFPYPLVTAEVEAILTPDMSGPDRDGVEALLIDHVVAGRVQRIGLGDDALWRALD
jgi:hypothetical protein